MPKTAALVLAAGKGTRMHSDKPKVVQPLLGEPMIRLVLNALTPVFAENIWVLVGHGAAQVEALCSGYPCVLQTEQLGTAHALATALPEMQAHGVSHILLVNGDTPLLTEEVVRHFMDEAQGADLAFATLTLKDPASYGRVVRKDGKIIGIVEAKDYDLAKYGAPTGEINAGMYLIDTALAAKLLPRVDRANKSGEYYVTDLIALALADGAVVKGLDCGDDSSLMGINSPLELAKMEEVLRERVIHGLLAKGVVIHAPASVRVSPLATVDAGVAITGPCEIYGKSHIHSGATIFSHCVITNTTVEGQAEIRSFSHLENAHVGRGALVGPYARLRPGAELGAESHVGNFVELKNTYLGVGAKANHLSYLGDAQIGEKTNIGAGTITCNYDGKNKFQTRIGTNAFIGSNTALVAPVSVGDGALIGAGSVITKDVPEGNLGIARERQKNLPRK